MDIYVGNLPFTATEDEITELFSPYGTVERVKIVMDRETGRPRGFAFVTMAEVAGANAAIAALNDQDYQGRALRINAAEAREPRIPRIPPLDGLPELFAQTAILGANLRCRQQSVEIAGRGDVDASQPGEAQRRPD